MLGGKAIGLEGDVHVAARAVGNELTGGSGDGRVSLAASLLVSLRKLLAGLEADWHMC